MIHIPFRPTYNSVKNGEKKRKRVQGVIIPLGLDLFHGGGGDWLWIQRRHAPVKRTDQQTQWEIQGSVE